MKQLAFDRDQNGERLFRDLYVGFNGGAEGRSSADHARNLAILDKLDAISEIDPAAEPWPRVDEARRLKPGTQRVAFTQNEFDALERAFEASRSMFVPVYQKRYLVAVQQLLLDAPTVKADEAAAQGVTGAPGAKAGGRKP